MALIDLSDKYPERAILAQKIAQVVSESETPTDLFEFRGATFRCHPSVLMALMNIISEKEDPMSYTALWLAGKKIGVSHFVGVDPRAYISPKWDQMWKIVSS
jgi:hypothetical protein